MQRFCPQPNETALWFLESEFLKRNRLKAENEFLKERVQKLETHVQQLTRRVWQLTARSNFDSEVEAPLGVVSSSLGRSESRPKPGEIVGKVAKQEVRIMIEHLAKLCDSSGPVHNAQDPAFMESNRKLLPCHGNSSDQYDFTHDQGLHVAKCRHNDVLLLADPIRFAPKEAQPEDLEVVYHYTDFNGFPLIATSGKLLVSKDVPRSHFGVGGYFSKKAPHVWKNRKQILANNYRPQKKEIDACAKDHLRWEDRVASRFCGRAEYCVAFVILKRHRYDIHEQLEADETRFHESKRLHDMMQVPVSCNKWGEVQPNERDVVVYNDNEGMVFDAVYFSDEWTSDLEHKINRALQNGYLRERLTVLDRSCRYLRITWTGINNGTPELPQLLQDNVELFPLQIKVQNPLPDFYEGALIASDPFAQMKEHLKVLQQLAINQDDPIMVDPQIYQTCGIEIEAVAWHLRRKDIYITEAMNIWKGVRHLRFGLVQQQVCDIGLAEFIIDQDEKNKEKLDEDAALREGEEVFCKGNMLEDAKLILCDTLGIINPDDLRSAFNKGFGEQVPDNARKTDERALKRRAWYGVARCLTDEDELKEEILLSVGQEYDDVLSPYHPKAIETKILLADTLIKSQQFDKKKEAKKLYQELRDLRAMVLGESHKLTKQLDLKLLNAYVKMTEGRQMPRELNHDRCLSSSFPLSMHPRHYGNIDDA